MTIQDELRDASKASGSTWNLPALLIRAADRLDALEAENERLREFASWLVAMGDPEDVLGRRDRQQVTLSDIISNAEALLAQPQEASGLPPAQKGMLTARHHKRVGGDTVDLADLPDDSQPQEAE